MIELRWKVETWEEYRDELIIPAKKTGSPVLQYREKEGPNGEQWRGEWADVPTVYIEG